MAATKEKEKKDTGSSEEFGPVILEGYWVILGEGKEVPEEARGHIASIVSSPWKTAYLGQAGQDIPGYVFEKDEKFRVQTRDEHNQQFECTEKAFIQVSPTRVGLGR